MDLISREKETGGSAGLMEGGKVWEDLWQLTYCIS
jgi:hypothetical protein